MKLHGLYILLIAAVVLSGCVSSNTMPTTTLNTSMPASTTSAVTPTWTKTLTPASTRTPTLTPPPMLVPEQAEEIVRTLLREPVDCPAPCFWGIIPGQTTLGEAKNTFSHLGLQVNSTTHENKDFYGITYEVNNGLTIFVILTVQNDIVENLSVSIHPEKYQAGVPREWLAYSPETLISRYGIPSRVDFFVGMGAPDHSYSIIMYFGPVDLIIQYGGYDITYDDEKATFRICPLIDQSDLVGIWLGKDPEYPPGGAAPLEEVTSLTLEEFAELMRGNPEDACLDLKAEVFR